MKVKHQLELLYFQIDKDLVCMDIVSTFHIIVIIYQSFNVKIFWNFWITNQFRTYFSSFFLYRNSSNFMFNLHEIQWSALWFQNVI